MYDQPLTQDDINNETKEFFFNKVGKDVADTPPHDGIVWHYTTLEAARSIIENGALWLSNCSFLNDANELTCAQNVLRHIVKTHDTNKGDSIITGFIDELLRLANSFRHHAIYIMSFCEDGDSLGQWRGYGNNVAIGFNIDYLDNISPSAKMRKVIYDRPVAANRGLELALK